MFGHPDNHSLINFHRSTYLHSDQRVVDSLFLHEFLVCADLYDFPVLKSSDDVGVADRRQAVGHYNSRPTESHLRQIHVKACHAKSITS